MNSALPVTSPRRDDADHEANAARRAVNPLFPFPDRLSIVFSAMDEKANS